MSSILLFELSTLLAFLTSEFGLIYTRLDEVRKTPYELLIHEAPENLYRAAVAAFGRELNNAQTNKSVCVVSSAGVPNARRPSVTLLGVEQDYYRALKSVANQSGWSIRIVYNIESIERLVWIQDYLVSMEGAYDLEARAVVNASQEMLAPLIIGDSHVFLAEGDRRFHAVRAGIEINNPGVSRFARRYFESLWQAPNMKVLRRATGIDETSFMEIRADGPCLNLGEFGSVLVGPTKLIHYPRGQRIALVGGSGAVVHPSII